MLAGAVGRKTGEGPGDDAVRVDERCGVECGEVFSCLGAACSSLFSRSSSYGNDNDDNNGNDTICSSALPAPPLTLTGESKRNLNFRPRLPSRRHSPASCTSRPPGTCVLPA